ncbi:MAG: hypothetical protein ACTSXQ_04610 [Alphaproteobacteria bacterium]
MSAAAIAAVFLYPVLLETFPDMINLWDGYFLPVMSCLPFLFIPSYVRKSKCFLGVDVLYRMVDMNGTGFDQNQEMPHTWKFS